MRKDTAISESVKRDIDQKIEAAESNFHRLTRETQNLQEEISDKQKNLRSLEADINLFPTEISGYVKQGAASVKLYAWLCAVPVLVIVVVTVRLFNNSQQLLNYVHSQDFSIFEYLVARLPYVAVSAIILAVAYTVLHRLISEIIGINRKRQDLFKISIIATDVSNASQVDLNLNDHQIYDLRTQTKMELLKEHLRQHIGEDYKYSPKSSLFHKLSTKLASNISDEEVNEQSG